MGCRRMVLMVVLTIGISFLISHDSRCQENALRDKAESKIVDLLANEIAMPSRFVVQSKFLITETPNTPGEEVRVTEGVQVLALDEEKRQRRVWMKASRAYAQTDSLEDLEHQGFESNGEFVYCQMTPQLGGNAGVPWQASERHGMGELPFFDPRYVWFAHPESYFRSCERSATASLGKADSVASWKDQDGNLNAIYARLQCDDKRQINHVSQILWKAGFPNHVQFLPAVRGDFSLEKLRQQSSKHDQLAANRCSWTRLSGGYSLSRSVSMKSSHQDGTIEFEMENTWLVGEKMRDQYLDDPRRNGAFELSKIDFTEPSK